MRHLKRKVSSLVDTGVLAWVCGIITTEVGAVDILHSAHDLWLGFGWVEAGMSAHICWIVTTLVSAVNVLSSAHDFSWLSGGLSIVGIALGFI